MTHCGPFNCETSIDRKKLDSPIYGGATEYDSLIKHKNLILYLHGHVHNGSKYAMYFDILIVELSSCQLLTLDHFYMDSLGILIWVGIKRQTNGSMSPVILFSFKMIKRMNEIKERNKKR